MKGVFCLENVDADDMQWLLRRVVDPDSELRLFLDDSVRVVRV